MSTTEHLSIFLVVSLILVSTCISFNPIPHVKADTWTWYDEFTNENSRWLWSYHAGTGYHLLTTVDGYSVAENGITAASTQYAYSDCALRYLSGTISQSQFVTIEIRAKFSHSMLQGAAKGSQGLIIWNGMSNFAGFLDFSVETQTGFTGLRAGVMSNGTIYSNQYLGDTYDPRNWHTYKIVLKLDGTALYVDGNLVAQTTQRPNSPAELNLWVDNAAYTLSGLHTNLDVTEDQKLYVDYVAWSDIDTTIPTGSIIINNGDVYTTSMAVTLSLTYADASSDVSHVRYSNDGAWDTETWEAPVATKSWTLGSSIGEKTVYYQIKNGAGLTNTFSDTIILDTTAPTGSVVINDDDASTTSTSATLSLTYADTGSGVSQVRYSNDGVWDSEAWESPSATKAWMLTSGDGEKTVYYQVKDNAGLLSSTISDTIFLGPTAPTGSIIINNGAASTTSTSVTLTLTYEDAGSGVSQVRYSNDGAWDTEEWESPASNRAWILTSGDGTKTVYYQVKNNVGIISATYWDTITLSTSPPTQPSDGGSTAPPVDSTKPTANAGSDQTVNEDATVTLDGSASSDNFGIESYTWTFKDETDRTLTEKIVSHTFSTPGVYTITLKVEDAAGNAATDIVVVTVLDVTDPMADAGQNQTVNMGASVSFDASASTDNIGVDSYYWDFGDGITGIGKTTTHKYANAGTYNVTLTVKDQANNLATDTIVVFVYEVGDFPLWLIGSVVAIIAIIAVVATLLLWRRQKTC